MKRFTVPLALERLQVLAWLEAHGFAGRDVHFGTGSGIPSNAGLSWLDGEYAKASQFNPIVGLEGVLHAIEDGVYSLFRFRLAHTRSLYDLIDEIEFDHWNLRLASVYIGYLFCKHILTIREGR
jgi:hypothetical protein